MSGAATTAGDASATGEFGSALLHSGELVADKYRLLEQLGAGSMGEVWRARHEELNSDVAIKFARMGASRAENERLMERFRFEAQVSAQLGARSRHIVSVHDVGRHGGWSYAVMEYVPGTTLQTRIERLGRIDPEEVADVVDQIAEALAIAHEEGIWHRDIKPANILIGSDGDRVFAKLTDFGVAKAFRERSDVDAPRATMAGMLVGTPAYMSPEQIGGFEPSAQADAWSLAVVAYEALRGRMPFRWRSFSDLVVAIGTRPHEPLAEALGLPAAVDAWFDRALAKDPLARFDDVRDMAVAFRAALAASRRRKAVPLWPMIALAGVLGMAVAAYVLQPTAAESHERATHSPSSAPAVEPSSRVLDEQPTASLRPTAGDIPERPLAQDRPLAPAPPPTALPAPRPPPAASPPALPRSSAKPSKPYDPAETL